MFSTILLSAFQGSISIKVDSAVGELNGETKTTQKHTDWAASISFTEKVSKYNTYVVAEIDLGACMYCM